MAKYVYLNSELFNTVSEYLLTALDSEDQDRFSGRTVYAIRECAISEKSYEVARSGVKNAIRDWLLGLGLSVDFTYYDIANRMREWGYTVDEDNDDDYYDKCDLYWDILTQVIYSAA